MLAWPRAPLIISLIAAALYLPSLAGEFVYDDHWTIVNNPFIRDVGNIPQLFDGRAVRSRAPDAWRPTMVVSLMVDHHLFGDHPTGYHLHSLLYHMGSVVLVWLLALQLSSSPPLAFIAALLFAVHPIHVEPVVAINYREDLLATFFCLAALAVLLGEGRAKRSWPVGMAAGGLLSVGLLAKGTAVVAPALLVVARRAQGARWTAALLSAAPLGVALLAFIAFRLLTAGSLDPYPATGVSPPMAEDSLLLRASSSLVALAATLWRMLVPGGLSPAYAPPDPGPVALLVSLLALVGLAAAAWRLLKPSRPELSASGSALAVPRTIAGAGIAFFLVAWLPTSGVVPLPNYQADRYAYLPSAGFCLAVAPFFLGDAARRWRLIGLAVLLISYAGAALLHQRAWRSDLALWTVAAKRAPYSSRAWSGLARALRREHRLVAAHRAGQRAVQLNPSSADARLVLANILTARGRYGEAEQQYARAAAGSARHPAYIYASWGWATFLAGDAQRAAHLLRRASTMLPRFAGVWISLARVEVARQRCEAAAKAAAEATRLDPANERRHLLLLRSCDGGTTRSRSRAKIE